MKPITECPAQILHQIEYVLTDIDDTLTLNGKLPAVAYTALERLWKANYKVIPITGRPAGWSDHIARMWPVNGVVGENGAFYFYYDTIREKMVRRYWKSVPERHHDLIELKKIGAEILKTVSGCQIAADQAYRESDLAIDFREDVPDLSLMTAQKIQAHFQSAGATAKISSIHVNAWFGEYDKLAMTRLLFREIFHLELDSILEKVIFIGDSPNDEPMFRFFQNTVGVANISMYLDQLRTFPQWVTRQPGGFGFAELADILLTR
ncbi:HAD-IIB family hydrolase [candidate division KSB1 bacterium]|nr:HAD-IIB family hydrolase [candidate division KSB1 bacterium]